jgi:hypothetical protein
MLLMIILSVIRGTLMMRPRTMRPRTMRPRTKRPLDEASPSQSVCCAWKQDDTKRPVLRTIFLNTKAARERKQAVRPVDS